MMLYAGLILLLATSLVQPMSVYRRPNKYHQVPRPYNYQKYVPVKIYYFKRPHGRQAEPNVNSYSEVENDAEMVMAGPLAGNELDMEQPEMVQQMETMSQAEMSIQQGMNIQGPETQEERQQEAMAQNGVMHYGIAPPEVDQMPSQNELEVAGMMNAVEIVKEKMSMSTTSDEVDSNIVMLEEIIKKMTAMVQRMYEMRGRQEVPATEMMGGMVMDQGKAMMSQQASGIMQGAGMMQAAPVMPTSSENMVQQEATDTNEVPRVKLLMTGGCMNMGMFLPMSDECKFAQCTYGPEPFKAGGVVTVVPVAMQCSPGMAVHKDYRGGYEQPCTVQSVNCGMPPIDDSTGPKKVNYYD